MFEILIVDDEDAVREGIRNTIDWKLHGFEIVDEAVNGAECIKKISKHLPDIIITDICMAEMDGMQLINYINQHNIDVDVVILTGYDELDYVKTALKNGISAYLLKPIQSKELIEALVSVKEKIITRRQAKIAMNTYKSQQGNDLLYELLNENNPDEEFLSSICLNLNIELPKTPYEIAYIQIDNPGSTDGIRNKDYLDLRDIIDNVFEMSQLYTLTYFIDKANIIVLIFQNGNIEIPLTIFNDILNQYFEIYSRTLTVGVSGIFRNLTAISRAYRQAVYSIEKKAILGNNRIIDYIQSDDSEYDDIAFSKNQLDSIIEATKNSEKDAAFAIINDFFDKLSKVERINIEKLKSCVMELAILLIRTLNIDEETMQSAFGRVLNPISELRTLEMVSDLHEWLMSVVETLAENPEINNLQSYKPFVQQAILHIMANYSKPLSVSMVAEKLFINPNYLMRSFKKETGKTFGEYLLDYRIKIAIQLIESKKYKIYEVGAEVGYTDPNHFSKFFKKMTGHSPKHYASKGDYIESDN